ncbi:hypothetical protein TREES_T100010377 [Tupaia chinensis]|uniref:Uncharacterized protein n=1 Tax=Tupaia chinensis TaxID=246437 RepID=L9LC96_TUPCH|nr:hypothetical protein TREES_T100010377 [Tupaia chinensis]
MHLREDSSGSGQGLGGYQPPDEPLSVPVASELSWALWDGSDGAEACGVIIADTAVGCCGLPWVAWRGMELGTDPSDHAVSASQQRLQREERNAGQEGGACRGRAELHEKQKVQAQG